MGRFWLAVFLFAIGSLISLYGLSLIFGDSGVLALVPGFLFLYFGYRLVIFGDQLGRDWID